MHNEPHFCFTKVLERACIHYSPTCGASTAARALNKQQTHLHVLASSPDEHANVKLVEALWAKQQINPPKDADKALGERVGGGKLQKSSCGYVAVVKVYKKDTPTTRGYHFACKE